MFLICGVYYVLIYSDVKGCDYLKEIFISYNVRKQKCK